MRDHYDFSKLKRVPNPFAPKAKKSITIRLDTDTIDYFKTLASTAGMPYQNLINLYLRECAMSRKAPHLVWAPQKP